MQLEGTRKMKCPECGSDNLTDKDDCDFYLCLDCHKEIREELEK